MPYSINDFMPSQDTLNNIKSLGSIDPVGSFRKGQADAEAAKQKSLMDALQLREGEANIEQSQSAVAQNNAQTAELNRQAQVRKDAQGMWANYQTQVTADPKNKDKITDNFKMELSRIGDKEGLDQLYKEEEAELNRLSAFDAMETNRTTRAKNQADTDATNEDRVLLKLVQDGKLPLYEFARLKEPAHAEKMREAFLNLLDSAAYQIDQLQTPEEQFQYAATILDPMLQRNPTIIKDLNLDAHYTQFRQAIDSQNPAALTAIIDGLGALVQDEGKNTYAADEVAQTSGNLDNAAKAAVPNLLAKAVGDKPELLDEIDLSEKDYDPRARIIEAAYRDVLLSVVKVKGQVTTTDDINAVREFDRRYTIDKDFKLVPKDGKTNPTMPGKQMPPADGGFSYLGVKPQTGR